MMKRLFCLLMTIAALASESVQAQIPDMKFRRLDTRNGLSNSQVNGVFKDSRGFVWLSTAYGLDRYDGYRIRTFYSDPNDTMSLSNNYVERIQEDFEGRLWIKQGMNFCIYDPLTEKFDRRPDLFFKKYGIDGGIERVYVDKKKRFWVKTYVNSVFCLDPATKRKTHFKMGYQRDEVPKDVTLVNFCEGEDCVIATTVDGELLGLDDEKGEVLWRDAHVREARGGVMADYVTYVDPEGNIWVVTNSWELHIYIKAERRWYRHLSELTASWEGVSVPDPLVVWEVMADDKGRIWLATDHEGLYVLDMKKRQLRQFTNDKFDDTTLSDITTKHLYQDYNGNVWIATYKNGVNLYVENMSNFKTVDVGDVNTILEDNEGRLWLGTNERGIIVLDKQLGEVDNLTKATAPFVSDIMVCSWKARDGALFFGTYEGGLMRYRNGQWKVWMANGEPNGLQTNNVWDIVDDANGNIWLGTLGGGVQRLDEQTDTFATYRMSNSKIASDYVLSMARSQKNWILAGTSAYYSLVNPRTGEVVNGEIPQAKNALTNSPSSTHVVQDSRGLYWQGSAAGVNVYDPETQYVTMLDMHTGLMGSNVVAVTEDGRKTMWVVTDYGVSNINVSRDDQGQWQFAVRSYNRRDGLQEGPYNQRAIYCAHDGRILVGGQGGLDIINPVQMKEGHAEERPIFSGLVVYDQEIAVGQEYDGRVILKKALDESRELKLRYADNQFTIQLASDAGTINNQSRFVYRLKGFNDRWSKTDPVNPNVTYMSLRPGTYTLCVKMLHDDGTIGTVESQLKITIGAPLYRTRWALLAYVLAVLAVVWLWRRRFLRQQAAKLLAEQTRRDLEQQQWMNEMRTRLMQEQQTGQKTTVAAGEAPTVTGEAPEAAGEAVIAAGGGSPVWDEPEELTLDLQVAELVGFVRQVTKQFQAPEGRQARLSFRSAVRFKMARFDAHQLGRALNTLLANSVKFSPTNCRIQVSVQLVGDGAEVRVADNGVGIRDEYKPHIFDHMLDQTEGIGLDTVKRIIDAHGGTISVEDNPGGGTVFVIILPGVFDTSAAPHETTDAEEPEYLDVTDDEA